MLFASFVIGALRINSLKLSGLSTTLLTGLFFQYQGVWLVFITPACTGWQTYVIVTWVNDTEHTKIIDKQCRWEVEKG